MLRTAALVGPASLFSGKGSQRRRQAQSAATDSSGASDPSGPPPHGPASRRPTGPPARSRALPQVGSASLPPPWGGPVVRRHTPKRPQRAPRCRVSSDPDQPDRRFRGVAVADRAVSLQGAPVPAHAGAARAAPPAGARASLFVFFHAVSPRGPGQGTSPTSSATPSNVPGHHITAEPGPVQYEPPGPGRSCSSGQPGSTLTWGSFRKAKSAY
ncbi:hypothetical protein NDU88_004575 [Pleurodeles waltl]|uniref:Uncharacterized protein n=1 Tax=Pleurodeles waltl TaxID=8319 RepID=A0AAV7NU46_PLEWA|nr:hypothetical protein NDU88_004575 [Pleurodeles waltl]